MSDENRKHMIEAYFQTAPVTSFFSNQFRSPASNFYTSESVELDIVRTDEEVAIAVQDITAGWRNNSADLFTNKEFIPPVFKESFSLTSKDLFKRVPGDNPFQDPGYRAMIITRFMDGMRKINNKIVRANELQASQVLQTGTATLLDANGAEIYAIDYKPKATHFPTSSTAWTDASPDILGDIESLGQVVRNDGKQAPDTLIMGIDAFSAFILDDVIQPLFDNRRIEAGRIGRMSVLPEDARFRGTVDVGNYKYDVVTYAGVFKDPNGGAIVPFMDPAKVILLSSDSRFDALFGAVPHIGRALGLTGGSGVNLPELPTRFGSREAGMDMFTNLWLSQEGDQLYGGVASRPLMVPTSIDTYGCLDTLSV